MKARGRSAEQANAAARDGAAVAHGRAPDPAAPERSHYYDDVDFPEAPPGGWSADMPPRTGPMGAEPVGGGAAVSFGAHAAFIGVALFGVQIFGAEPEPLDLVQQVELISAPEFDAAQSQAPDAPVADLAALAAPVPTFDDAPMSAEADIAPEATTEFVYGDVADEEEFPDLSAVLTPLQRAKVGKVSIADLAPAAGSLGASGPGLTAPSMGLSSPGLRAPGAGSPGLGGLGGMRMGRASLGIDTRADSAPPPPAPDRQAPDAAPESDTLARADKAVEANAPDPEAAPDASPEEAQEAAAPEAASDRKITEADETQEDAPEEAAPIESLPEAPVTARLPVGRSQGAREEWQAARAAEEAARRAEEERLAAEKEAAEAEAQRIAAEKAEAEKARKAAEAQAAADKAAAQKAAEAKKREEEAAKKAAAAKAAAEAEKKKQAAAGTAAKSAGAGDVPIGAPMTSGEIRGLVSTISRHWNTSMLERMPNWRSLSVTMRIRLDQSGKLQGEPEVISPARVSGAHKFAVQAATRALKKAKYTLPPGKYGRWREIEVTFDPASGVSM